MISGSRTGEQAKLLRNERGDWFERENGAIYHSGTGKLLVIRGALRVRPGLQRSTHLPEARRTSEKRAIEIALDLLEIAFSSRGCRVAAVRFGHGSGTKGQQDEDADHNRTIAFFRAF